MSRRERLDDVAFARFRQLVEDEETVNINCTNEYKDTLLSLLCENHQTDSLYSCVKILFAKQPDIGVNQTDNCDKNALMKLCESSRSEAIVQVAELLIERELTLTTRRNTV